MLKFVLVFDISVEFKFYKWGRGDGVLGDGNITDKGYEVVGKDVFNMRDVIDLEKKKVYIWSSGNKVERRLFDLFIYKLKSIY